jgi:biotin-dependent carboxylase-like uncharacterized protein
VTVALETVRPGMLDLVVDTRPRHGLAHGLSEAGPLDLPAFRRAARVVGNGPEAAALELLALGPVLRVVGGPVQIAVSGGPLTPVVDGTPLARDQAWTVPAGSELRFLPSLEGLRSYLAVAGGLDPPPVFGSRSADLPSALPGLAGRRLAAGDLLPVGTAAGPPRPVAAGPPPQENPDPLLVRVLPGPQWHRLARPIRRALLAGAYTVSGRSNRVGIRLEGDPLPGGEAADISEGNAPGAVQLPPSGLPVILLADRGSIGGYARPLQVITADLWRLGQARPGQRLRFVATSRAAAWAALRAALGSEDR